MSYNNLLTTSWKFYDLALLTGEALGWVALIVGAIGFAMTKTNPTKHQRYRGLMVGGAAALCSVLLAGHVYRAITYVMLGRGVTVGDFNHAAALYPDVFLESFGEAAYDIVTMVGILSQVAAVIGMAALSFGAGLWGVSPRRSFFNRKGARCAYGGIGLMIASVMERGFAIAGYVFLTLL